MKTEYNIIWIDDDFGSVENDVAAVRSFLQTHGIAANIQEIESDGDGKIHEQVREIVANQDLDLIVVDYVMDGMNGRELIDLIRSSDHVFLPVVFYSSVGVAKLASEVAAAQLDGVYLSPRDGVRNKIELVITSLIRKEQSSKRTRGLLMEGVSELDAKLLQVLEKIWARSNSMQRGQLTSYFKKKVSDRSKNSAKSLDEFPTDEEPFWDHASTKFVSGDYDTMIRWKVIKKGLELVGVDAELQVVFHELFEMKSGQPLIPLRNKYGHQTRLEIEKTHADTLCVHIRKELRRQTDNITSITDSLQIERSPTDE